MQEQLIQIAIAVLTALAIWAVKKSLSYLDAKTSFMDGEKDIKRKEYAKKRVLDIIKIAVGSVEQTLVKGAREKGKLTVETGVSALAEALDIVKGAIIEEGLGTVSEKLLTAKVEAVVGANKQVKP